MKNHMISVYKKVIALSVLAGFVCLFVLPAPEARSQVLVDRIVAIVNEDIIRLSDLNRHLLPIEQQIRSRNMPPERETEMLYEARMQLIDELINETLADQVIRESGIRASEAEINAAIEQIKSANRITQEDLERALLARGMTMEVYREDMRQQILRSKLINQKVKSKIVITEEDVREHYEANPDKFGLAGKYRLRNIFMMFGQDRRQAREEMEEVLEALNAGASFSGMAEKYSMAPNARDGGELGLFALNDLSEHLQPIMAELQPGEHTGIVETDLGFQIFLLEDIEKPQKQDFEDFRKKIEQQLYEQQVEERFDEWIESLRESAHIRIVI